MESPNATTLRSAGPLTRIERTQRGLAAWLKTRPGWAPAEVGAPLVQPPGSVAMPLEKASPAAAVIVTETPVFGRTVNGSGSESTVAPGWTRMAVRPPK